MATVVAGGCQLPSISPVQEKGSKNKRKFHTDSPLVSGSDSDPNVGNGTDDLGKSSLPMIGFPNYEIPDGRSEDAMCLGKGNCCNMCIAEQNIDLVKPASETPRESLACKEILSGQEFQEELNANEFQDADWNELTEAELEELVLNNLHAIYQTAIKRIASSGYTLDVAKHAVLRCWRCYGTKDPVSNIVDNVLAFLNNGQEMDSKDDFFQDLPQLETHILDEMVCVLREMRPLFSEGDALWCLLICDMNIAHACALDTEAIPSFGAVENVKPSHVSIVPQSKSDIPEILPVSGSKPNQPNGGCTPIPSSFMPIVSGIPNLPPVKFPSSKMPCTSQNSENSVSSERHPNEGSSSLCWPLSLMPKGEELVGGSNISSTCVPRESPDICKEQVTSAPQIALPDPKYAIDAFKPDSYRKHHFNNFKRVHFRQKYGQAEYGHGQGSGGKAPSKWSKYNKLGCAVLDRKWNLESDCSSGTLKFPPQSCEFDVLGNPPLAPSIGTLKFGSNAGSSTHTGVEQNTTNFHVSCPLISADLPLSLVSKGSVALEMNQKILDDKNDAPTCGCPHRLPCQIFGQCGFPDAKDEKLVLLVSHARALQSQLHQWTEWAQQKVMQAAQRLSKDRAELKSLNQEKDEAARMIKERKTLEENTLKRLSDMQTAILKTTAHLGHATTATHRLEVENQELRRGLESVKARAEEAAANCLEVLNREEETLNNINSRGREKELIQEELAKERRKRSQLQQQLLQAKEHLVTMEDKWRREKKAKEEALLRVNSEKEERRQLEHRSKSKEDEIHMEAERDYQRYRDDIQKLEDEITQLRLKTDSSKIATHGTGHSYVSHLTNTKSTQKLKDSDPGLFCDVGGFQELSAGDVQRNRECVMCLTEEMSVVFLPCAHQVVCMNCNQLHEKQGMKDCPSCRAPILQRIYVRFVDS